MPGKSPFLKKIASWPVKAMTSRYPRLGDVTRAARSALNGPPLPDIDWIIAPIRMQRSRLEKVRLNCLISTIDAAKAWAGNMMTTELFESLLPHFDSARILVFDQTTPAQLARFPSFRPVPRGEESDEPRQIVTMPESQDRPLPVGANDLLITSHFSHAYRCINQIIPWQVREFGRAPGPMVYLIQDYEPGFWAWSSEYLLAESTYRAPNPVVAVFSSSILRDYFRGQNYTFFKEYSFEPKLNSVLAPTIS